MGCRVRAPGPWRVYAAVSGRSIKFGCSQCLRTRVQNLKSERGAAVRMFASVEIGPEQLARTVEALLHDLASPDRIEGEWFKRTVRTLALARAMRYAETSLEFIGLLCKCAHGLRTSGSLSSPLTRRYSSIR